MYRIELKTTQYAKQREFSFLLTPPMIFTPLPASLTFPVSIWAKSDVWGVPNNKSFQIFLGIFKKLLRVLADECLYIQSSKVTNTQLFQKTRNQKCSF